MGQFLENIDMEFVRTMTEEEFDGLAAYALNEGSPIFGYYGLPYFRCDFGDAQFFFHTGSWGDGKLELTTFDTHVAGNCVWRVKNTEMKPADESLLQTERRCLFAEAENGKGLFVVNVVNADVLPSFMEGDEYRLQMVAFAYDVEYYKDDEEYDATLPEDNEGKKFGLDDGAVFPSGFMINHVVRKDGTINEVDEERESATAIKGTVKSFYVGKTEMGNNLIGKFVRCIVDTQFGEIEIVHKYEQVKEEQRDNMVAGAKILAVVYMSGDAAIYEYENGIVRDEENHLKLLRYTMTKGDTKRLKNVLSENVEYISGNLEETVCGKASVMDYIDYVKDCRKDEIVINVATFAEADESEDQRTIEKKCLLIGYKGCEDYGAALTI
ncbi:MAG: hypothetical protein IKD97_00790, partial [Firmicutes bacterium]|nr:hypothetical protein [Bacillota bacterium]